MIDLSSLSAVLTRIAKARAPIWAYRLWREQFPEIDDFGFLTEAIIKAMNLAWTAGFLPTSSGDDLKFSDDAIPFGAPPADQTFLELIDALKSKYILAGVQSPRELDPIVRQTAFYLSGNFTAETTQAMRDLLVTARSEGWGEEKFLEAASSLTELSGDRLDVIWQTNIASAAGAGRWKQAMQGQVQWAAFKYYSRKGPHTRPLHAAMHGFVASSADPIWRIIWPPCGFRCQCSTAELSKSDAARFGPLDNSGRLAARHYANDLQRDVVAAAESGFSMIVDGKPAKFPDDGFRGNALAGLV